jgi:ATR interacting protein
MLLQLMASSSAASGHFQASVLGLCLKVLVKLAENASSDLLPRYKEDPPGGMIPWVCLTS